MDYLQDEVALCGFIGDVLWEEITSSSQYILATLWSTASNILFLSVLFFISPEDVLTISH